MNTEQSALIDVNTVAKILSVTPRHVQRLVAERRIPFLKVGRFVRFDPGELNEWLERQRVGTSDAECRNVARGR